MSVINYPPYPLANGRKPQLKNHNGGTPSLWEGWGGINPKSKIVNPKPV